MKIIQLNHGHITSVDDEDFEELNKYKWYAWYNKYTDSYYAVKGTWINKKRGILYMHRFIMQANGRDIKVDHKDRDTLNNQRSNLRFATHGENCANRKSMKNSTSKYLGVCWHKSKRKWKAAIEKNRTQLYLGLFTNEEDAAKAYDLKAIELHGEFANLNFKST